mmetsp:Transcript_47360/g.34660  ORF Transcript_47360/g.34660 Transcript_47360/m.34660 type:complete len:114 (-) Transcript_47360:196-537(-)
MLFLTDGSIHDMRDTKDVLVECSRFPLSVIIIGIGDADFSNMIELDADEEVLKNSQGKVAARDIVQFVEFNQFKESELNQLAEEVLEEVPEQVVSYMIANSIKAQQESAFQDN